MQGSHAPAILNWADFQSLHESQSARTLCDRRLPAVRHRWPLALLHHRGRFLGDRSAAAAVHLAARFSGPRLALYDDPTMLLAGADPHHRAGRRLEPALARLPAPAAPPRPGADRPARRGTI